MRRKYMVREFTEADTSAVRRVFAETHRVAGQVLPDDKYRLMMIAADGELGAGLTDIRRYYMRDGSKFFVISPEDDPDEIAGYAAVCKREEGRAELKNVIVNPDHQGQGLGRLLMETVEAYARTQGYHTLELWTYAHLTAATAMYERRGYRQGELVLSPDMFVELEPLYYTMPVPGAG